MRLEAVIFDLDGVLTDTAELHFQAWQALAQRLGAPFDRAANEQLRGVSRRRSLELVLGQSAASYSEQALQQLMAEKNAHYVALLASITEADLLPGAAELLNALDRENVPYALASASKNARLVLQALGIAERFRVIADGSAVERPKPAPDLFRFAAAQCGVTPDCCLVVEDAAAGVEAALSAGMSVLAVGPAARFAQVATGRYSHRDSLAGLTLADLQSFMQPDPAWVLSESKWEPDQQRHRETVLTAGNGYFSSRGSLEERFPDDQPVTFAHGIFDDMPVSFTELVNLPNWLATTILVDGHRFSLAAGELLHFTRMLDLSEPVSRRTVRWSTPEGTVVDITFERFISYANQHLGALQILVTAVNRPCHVVIGCQIDGHVANQNLLHWHHREQGAYIQAGQCFIWLDSQTRSSKLDLASAAKVTANGTPGLPLVPVDGAPQATISKQLAPGQSLQLQRLNSYTSSRDRAEEGSHRERALAIIAEAEYEMAKAAHLRAWRALWAEIDLTIVGDVEAQLAMRFSQYQLLVAAPQQDDRVSIGAKTLSGYGYRGHVFWDTEIFILPFFTYCLPDIARNMLMYRYHTLPGARRKASENGLKGAQYAWESAASGDEVTPTWVPNAKDRKKLTRIWTGDIQIHITADIAYAILQYWRVTKDDAFLRDYGAEIILDGARFWAARAEYESVAEGGYQYSFRDVIGPDEYHDHVDNNAFTNRMAQWHLQQATKLVAWLKDLYPEKHAALVSQLELTADELAHWQDVIDHTVFIHDAATGLILQFEGFFDLKQVDWPAVAGRTQSMQTLLGIEGANAHQVLKQADVIMLLCLLRDEYEMKSWRANWDTYMPLTDHSYGSSLGPSFHAWAAAEIGRPDEAYEHFMLAARSDLRNIRGNASEGIHAASAGGLWQAVVFGFAGMYERAGEVLFKPRLPAHWQAISFRFRLAGQPQRVLICREGEAYDITVRPEP